MKITLASNGWTPIVSDVDLGNLTPEEIQIIGCLLGTHTMVIVKKQNHLTVENEVKFLQQFGEVQVDGPEVKHVVLENSNRMIRRVSGKRRTDGTPEGVFGFKQELPWHANPVENPNRKSVVYLRAIGGTTGSVTSFTNHVRAWEKTVPADLKKYLLENDLHVIHEHDHTHDLAKETMLAVYGTSERKSMYKFDQYPKLLYQNKFGVVGLYISWLQFGKFVSLNQDDSRAIVAKLKMSILGDQNNIYDHHWEDGDVLMADQWFGVHKRHHFEGVEHRLLHRAVIEYTNIDPAFKDQALSLVNKS
jgi:alpha-ketoglutarate-dependent taurine dioxygenase